MSSSPRPRAATDGGRDSTQSHTGDRLARERAAHDQLARSLRPAELPPEFPGELERALFHRAAPAPRMRVLDLGCGSGDLTLQLIDTGAQVTALDISSGMLDVARARVARFRPDAGVEFVAAQAENTGLPDGSFDLVIGRFILHHVDIPSMNGELRRLLTPGGKAVLLENSGRNVLLMAARRHVIGRWGIPRLGTEDERPLSSADIAVLRREFPDLELHYPVFEFFRIFDRQVLRFRSRTASRFFAALDQLSHDALPWVRRYSYRVLVVLPTPSP